MVRLASRWARRRVRPLAAGAAALCLAAALAALARGPAPARVASVAEFPRVRVADLAHLLADVSAHALIPAPWTLEEEAGNYSMWRYAVAFSCGARCAGRAAVCARADLRLQHGAARAHRVTLQRWQCRALPLLPLPWPQLCDEIEIEWEVTGSDGGGARLAEAAQAQCGALATMLAQCPGATALRRDRAAHLQRLRALLQDSAASAARLSA